MDLKGREINNTRERVQLLENNVIHKNNQNIPFYNKRNDYFTIFDDKKTLSSHEGNFQKGINYVENNSRGGYIENNNNNINQTNLYGSRVTPIKTNVMPTTSSTYGAYYNFNNSDNFSNNRINY